MDDVFRSFCQSIIDNVKKNGFPKKKVAFPLERMYALAEEKGVDFNKVLETLHDIEIEHKKNPEKIIFFPRPKEPLSEPKAAPSPNPFMEMDFSNMDLGGMDMSNMDMSKMLSMASEMMKHMTPEQLAAAQKMALNMSDEDRAALFRQAQEMGFLPQEED